jgi:hypothetical protein
MVHLLIGFERIEDPDHYIEASGMSVFPSIAYYYIAESCQDVEKIPHFFITRIFMQRFTSSSPDAPFGIVPAGICRWRGSRNCAGLAHHNLVARVRE